jgi:hypothetical protein
MIKKHKIFSRSKTKARHDFPRDHNNSQFGFSRSLRIQVLKTGGVDMTVLRQLPRGLLLLILIAFAFLPVLSRSTPDTNFAHAESVTTLQQPAASPTPMSNPLPAQLRPKEISALRRVFDFLKCNAAKLTKEQELYRSGPQFPLNYDDNDFSFVALVKGKWDVTIEYQLDLESTAYITFVVKDAKPFSQELYSAPNDLNSKVGGIHRVNFQLPEEFGDKPQPALISFKATVDESQGKVLAGFQLYSLGIGNRFTFSPQPKSISRPDTEFTVRDANPALPVSYRDVLPNEAPVGFGAVEIEKIDVAPDALVPAGMFKYTFDSTDPFSRWNADYHRKTKQFRNGRYVLGTQHLQTIRHNELVFAGRNPRPPGLKEWQITRGKQFGHGEYKIQVTAFLRADAGENGGKSATRFSRPLKIN